jgi:hypothetical protein
MRHYYFSLETMTKIAIIGVSGRDADVDNLKNLGVGAFDSMCEAVFELIDKEVPVAPSSYTFVSGGAAWADHIAVRAFRKYENSDLILHLPCAFKQGKFQEGGCAAMCNFLHGRFQRMTGVASLQELDAVIQEHGEGRVSVNIYSDFFSRNRAIATGDPKDKCDYLIALSFTNLEKENKGLRTHGTTWPHIIQAALRNALS